MDSSSSSVARKNTKLSVRRKPSFKKTTNLGMREQTLLKKALELSTLCEIEACVLHYSRDGELIQTWPEDHSKVRDLAERFSRLSDREKLKKSSNLFQFLNKKMNDETKRSLEGKDDGKFSQRVSEIEASLQNIQHILQDRRSRVLQPQDHQTEPDQNQNFMVPSSAFIFFTIQGSADEFLKRSEPSCGFVRLWVRTKLRS
ncbi:unnamed protein product [Thlaspi arvense]|uniref:MADS-box domain-containing protein n=1 Tax=Thlaspi arvense TaxID=13288 RepID=A0AAU9R8Q2_THLAR|nr:unnamed protein product [Thlaspi arvense]